MRPMMPVTDIELAVSVDLMLQGNPKTAGAFQVAVSDGVVTLEGNASCAAQRDAAMTAAQRVDGVKMVVSHIQVVA
jgi:osmotically-inducible protein OsmY